MKDKTLLDLYYGKITPAEHYQPLIEEFIALQKKHYRHYDEFMEKLGSPLNKEFESIMDEQLELLPFDFSQTFIDGFRLGAKMMMEILWDYNQKPDCEENGERNT